MSKKGTLSHVDANGEARMVDVSGKEVSFRMAEAAATVRLPPAVLEAVVDGDLHTSKGPVFHTARIAGINAAKQAGNLIPFCHPLPLEKCDVSLELVGECVEIRCRVALHARTGVEMEALAGASLAALTVYDMCKALSHEMVVERVELLHKEGGRSGPVRRKRSSP